MSRLAPYRKKQDDDTLVICACKQRARYACWLAMPQHPALTQAKLNLEPGWWLHLHKYIASIESSHVIQLLLCILL
jgi:hypothetical protein